MFLKFLLLGSAVLFLFGCSTTITATNTVPPRAGKLNVTKVGVLEIKGDQNNYFTNTLSSVIDKVEEGGRKRFQVYDRAQIENIIREQKFQTTIADPNTMVKFGRLSGIEAGFFGGLNYTTGSRSYLEKRTKCEKENCYEYNVSCTDTDHALRTTLSLTDFSTAKILYSNTFNKSRRVKTCNDSGGATSRSTSGDEGRFFELFATEREVEETPAAVKHLTNSAEPFVQFVNTTLTEIARDLGEYYVISTIEIEKSDDTLSKADQQKFERGVDFAAEKRLDRACEI
ncbi:MAG: CsgG/HfaB family protein [Deferribacteraceae bacterium]|jgi:hypothetical protein|nr:CsgG/HfaB family protein [Deferribacteraceae bacterium]